MLRKIIFMISLVSCVACSGHGPNVFFSNKNKPLYKNSTCSPGKAMPQMVLIPFFERASQIMPNCQTHPKHKTALAMLVFYHKWSEYFGDHNFAVRGMLQKVMIQWDLDKRTSPSGFNLDGARFQNRIIVGRVESKELIWVWAGYDHKISESALIHELVHLALMATNGSYDADHEGSKYNGWTLAHSLMIDDAEDMLRAFNL